MEAVSATAIPQGDGWQYEPKWDGFRCLAFRDGNTIQIQLKSKKVLTVHFPKVVDALLKLSATSIRSGRRCCLGSTTSWHSINLVRVS
jgi:ATP-dependent DNA ligase